MGQYFKLINTQKKEFVCPWCVGGGAKLWEWAASPHGALLTLLLQRSTAPKPLPADDDSGSVHDVTHLDVAGSSDQFDEGMWMVGRWAGDPVFLVGDYDDTIMYQTAKWYRNLSEALVGQWNEFIQLDDYQLTYELCSSCC